MSESSGNRTSLNLTESRQRRLNRVKELTGESTNTKALDKAMHHLEKTAREIEELAPEFQDRVDSKTVG